MSILPAMHLPLLLGGNLGLSHPFPAVRERIFCGGGRGFMYAHLRIERFFLFGCLPDPFL